MKNIFLLIVTVFFFCINANAQIEVDSSGNVGIGTTAPGSELDVVGVIKASGGNSTQWNSDADSTNELQLLSVSGDTIFISNGNFIIVPGLTYLNTLCNTDADADGVSFCSDCNDNDSTIYPGAPEICDFKDNDCDGLVDEDFPLLGQSCSTGLPGICAAGTFQCQGGVMVCVSNNNPSAELCNNLDDNCDGQVDEGNPGGGASCNTGLPGVCASGTTQCQGGSIVCVSNNNPSPEVCNNLDDDCNGAVDEGNPGGGGACNTGLPGVCGVGVLVCNNGSLTCVQINFPSTEVCGDGLDNNCDGQVDEGCP